MRMELGEISVRISAAAPVHSDRLTASSGILSADAAGLTDGYAAEAWVPRQPFRRLDRQASRSLRREERMERSKTVGLMCIPPALLHGLRADAARPQSPGGLAHHSQALGDCLAAEWDVEVLPRRLSLGRSAPGLATVTRDPGSGHLVGLHVDTFHEDYTAPRSNAGNRVSVNVGNQARYFLFVPLPFQELYRRSGAKDQLCANFVARFLEANPDQCVLRLRVDPGEAYIAPTESVVHDASTLPSLSEDVHVTGRGIFNPRRC